MSDEAVGVAVPDGAPTPAEAPVQDPSVSIGVTSPETPDFKSIADVRKFGRQGARELADQLEANRRADRERPRDEQGRFVSSEAGPTDVESVPEFPAGVPVLDPAVEATPEPEAKKDDLPDGWVRIELDKDDPLRKDRGQTSIAVPQELANDLRYALNQPVRKREVAELRSNLDEAERFAIAAQAEAQYWKAQVASPVSGEDLDSMKADVLRAYPGRLGEIMWAGIEQKLSGEDTSGVEAAKQEALREVETQRILQQGERFVDYAMRDALYGVDGRPPRFPGWDQNGMARALKVYGQFLKAEGRPNMDGAEFVRDFAMPMYLRSEPGKRYGQEAANRLRQQQVDKAREQGRQDAEKTHQEKLKEAAERHRTNPTARLPLNAGLAARSADPASEAESYKGLDIDKLKKKLRSDVRAMAGSR